MIPSETVSLVRERVDIVEVIGQFVELRRAGTNFKGLCPFHQEKTPSFNVNPARQMFHCFGCGVGGDAISFLMSYEGRTFADAVRTLAAKVGVLIEEREESPKQKKNRDRQRGERERLLVVMEAAARFYAEQLQAAAGSAAREYLQSRGIGGRLIEDFCLGYATDKWDGLLSRLGSLGVSPAEAEKVGLVAARKSGSGFYDRFRDRVIFPVHDAAGRVVALGGRVLPGAPADAPKYVNSPESAIFSKSRTLFGLHRAREALRHRESPILVEGNVDVISMHAYGFTSAVAPMGTALTQEQALLLRRFAGREATVTLLFDGDEAGRSAAIRAQGALAEAGLGARVATLPPSEDPDSYLRRHGAAKLKTVIDDAQGLIEHLIDDAAAQAGSDGHSKIQGIRALVPVLTTVTDLMERDHYCQKVARAFGVAEEVVRKHLQGKAVEGPPEPSVKERVSGRRKAEGTVIGALLDHPTLWSEAARGGASELLLDQTLSWVFDYIGEVAGGTKTLGDIVEDAADDRTAVRLRARLTEPQFEDVEAARRALLDGLQRLRELAEREAAEQLDEQIREAMKAGDSRRVAELSQEKLLLRRRVVGQVPDGAAGL